MPAQARIVRQIVRAFAPDERGEKRQHRQALRGEKRRLRDQRSRFCCERSEIFLDRQNILRRLIFRRGIFVRGNGRHHRRAAGVDGERHGRLRERVIFAVVGIEKGK